MITKYQESKKKKKNEITIFWSGGLLHKPPVKLRRSGLKTSNMTKVWNNIKFKSSGSQHADEA